MMKTPKSKSAKHRRDLSSDEDSVASYNTSNKDMYDDKNKKPAVPIQKAFQNFIFSLKNSPKETIKKSLWKIGFYVWCIAVFLSILSLLGFPVKSLMPSFGTHSNLEEPGNTLTTSSRRLGSTSSSWSSILAFASSTEDKEQDEVESKAGELVEDEDIPQQIIPSTPKQGNTLNKKLEKELACEEMSCVDSCNRKIKPKCAKSASCKKDREKLCKRRCRKIRCEDRCKDEPKFGYVEREQRMEKCKDDCTGPTAVHNKCIKKCHSQFKPCKSRCYEIASKYICDKVPDVVQLIGKGTDDEEDDDEDNNVGETEMEDNEGGFDSDAEDDEDEEESSSKVSSSSSVDSILAKGKSSLNTRRSLSTMDLIEDPDLI